MYDKISIAKAMGIEVVTATSEQVILSAPLSNNINHKQTVFGGSLQAVATLACWSFAQVAVDDGYQTVITHSEIDYLSPVSGDFQAIVNRPEVSVWEKFQKTLVKIGKAKLALNATIRHNNVLAVNFHGDFAVISKGVKL